MTAQRVLLARYLESKDDAFSAEEINADLPSVGRAPVYRTLKLLLDQPPKGRNDMAPTACTPGAASSSRSS